MKSAIILGTSRPCGNTYQLAQAFNEIHPCELFCLSNYHISEYDYEHKNSGDDFIPLMEELLTYDRYIYATPVYWYSMSAQLKIFFDRLSDLLTIRKDLGRQLRGKSNAILSTGVQEIAPHCFEEAFTLTFDYLGMKYQGLLYCQCDETFRQEAHLLTVEEFANRVRRET